MYYILRAIFLFQNTTTVTTTAFIISSPHTRTIYYTKDYQLSFCNAQLLSHFFANTIMCTCIISISIGLFTSFKLSLQLLTTLNIPTSKHTYS